MGSLSRKAANQSSIHFDYEVLSPSQRRLVQQRTGEIRVCLQRTARDVWEIGQKLADVRSQIKWGQFEAWLKAEFGWSRRTAYNFINVFEAFPESAKFAQIEIATSALYKLAAPSTPQPVREQFLARAEKGEKITHKQVSQACKSGKRGAPPPPTPRPEIPLSEIITVIPKGTKKLSPPVESDLRSSPLNSGEQAASLTTPAIQTLEPALETNHWYAIGSKHVLFFGDTASDSFIQRIPEAELALAITSDDWDHDWLIELASTMVLLKESSLQAGLIEQTLSLYSEPEHTIIFPWLPDQDMLAIAHRLDRRIVAGDPNRQRCQQAIRQLSLPVVPLPTA